MGVFNKILSSRRLCFLPSLVLFLMVFNVSGNASQTDLSRFVISQTTATNVDYLIITSEDYEDALQPLVEWKMQRGLGVAIEAVEEITDTYEGEDEADQIRNCIIDYHLNKGTVWVLLAGGSHVIPTRTVRVGNSLVDCDSYYSNLDDNWNLYSNYATLNDPDDWSPEVFVGRLPAESESQMDSLVTRLIQYEKNPPVGSWMEHAVYAGTFANFDYDENGNNILDEDDFPAFDANFNHNWMKTHFLPDGWTSTLLAEAEGLRTSEYSYDMPINETNLVSAINAGASIVMADAHGSTTDMYRTIFTNDVDGDSLFDYGIDQQVGAPFLGTSTEFDTDGKLGFYFLAACSTGSFTEGECLTEYITQSCGIGCIGSSNSAYYDPSIYTYGGEEHLGWHTQGLSERIWKHILVLGDTHPGKALALAKYDYSRDRVQYEGATDGGQTMAQFNLMGDPEVPLWIGTPSTFEAPIISVDAEKRTILVCANDEESMLCNITITLYGDNCFQKVITGGSGEGILSMPDLSESENHTITLSRDGSLPLQIVVELPAGSLPIDFLPAGIVITMVAFVSVGLYWYKTKKS